jgi:hypothetical protein
MHCLSSQPHFWRSQFQNGASKSLFFQPFTLSEPKKSSVNPWLAHCFSSKKNRHILNALDTPENKVLHWVRDYQGLQSGWSTVDLDGNWLSSFVQNKYSVLVYKNHASLAPKYIHIDHGVGCGNWSACGRYLWVYNTSHISILIKEGERLLKWLPSLEYRGAFQSIQVSSQNKLALLSLNEKRFYLTVIDIPEKKWVSYDVGTEVDAYQWAPESECLVLLSLDFIKKEHPRRMHLWSIDFSNNKNMEYITNSLQKSIWKMPRWEKDAVLLAKFSYHIDSLCWDWSSRYVLYSQGLIDLEQNKILVFEKDKDFKNLDYISYGFEETQACWILSRYANDFFYYRYGYRDGRILLKKKLNYLTGLALSSSFKCEQYALKNICLLPEIDVLEENIQRAFSKIQILRELRENQLLSISISPNHYFVAFFVTDFTLFIVELCYPFNFYVFSLLEALKDLNQYYLLGLRLRCKPILEWDKSSQLLKVQIPLASEDQVDYACIYEYIYFKSNSFHYIRCQSS